MVLSGESGPYYRGMKGTEERKLLVSRRSEIKSLFRNERIRCGDLKISEGIGKFTAITK
jgi:hypothetical protein